MSQLSIIKQMFEALSDEEKANFVAYLKGGTQKNSKPLGNLAQLILSHNHAERPDCPCCPHCGSVHIIKNGHKGGAQRYMCKDCKKTFAITNNTILFSTKKKLSTWEKYLECMMNKFSIRKCADVCKISVSTAFIWRHKSWTRSRTCTMP